MVDIPLSVTGHDEPDDLPRAFQTSPAIADTDAERVQISDIDVPFWQLMVFLIKLAFAAIPALLLAIAFLFALSELVTMLFPGLVKLKVLIYAPPG